MKTMKRPLSVLLLLLAVLPAAGCAVAHRYPAYRGKVLELGTDKPIEGAGVLAAYWLTVSMPPERNSRYVGYQAVLTDRNGKFEIPSKAFYDFKPLAWFSTNVAITIYKRGYANFSGGFHVNRSKHGKSAPELVGDQLPPGTEVTFWFPRLETEKEIREHDEYFSFTAGAILDEKSFPPPGTKKGQFLPPDY